MSQTFTRCLAVINFENIRWRLDVPFRIISNRLKIKSFYGLISLALFSISLQSSGRDISPFEDILIDAQEDNASKKFSGEMKYTFSFTNKGFSTQSLESNVRWSISGNALWTYKIIYQKRLAKDSPPPVSAAVGPTEYKLRIGNRLYNFTAATNQLHLNQIDNPNRKDSEFFMFDILPETFGSRCCPPFHPVGRKWSDFVGSRYAKLFPEASVSLEKVSGDIIRQTTRLPSGSIGTIDFSIENSGLPVRMDWTDPLKPESNSLEVYKWKKVVDKFVVEDCQVLRGNFKENLSQAKESYSFHAESIRPSSSGLNLSFENIRDLLPKNTVLVDHIRNRSTPLFGKASSGLSDEKLDELSDKIRMEGFAAP